jgi:hypothetical protein
LKAGHGPYISIDVRGATWWAFGHLLQLKLYRRPGDRSPVLSSPTHHGASFPNATARQVGDGFGKSLCAYELVSALPAHSQQLPDFSHSDET